MAATVMNGQRESRHGVGRAATDNVRSTRRNWNGSLGTQRECDG